MTILAILGILIGLFLLYLVSPDAYQKIAYFEIYTTPHLERAVTDQINFFKKHLLS